MTDRLQEQEPLHPVARQLAPPASGLERFPPVARWDDWEELDAKAWPRKVKRRFQLIPTICFNCEAACGLLAYVDPQTLQIQKFEGNPVHPGSRGRNYAKGPATLNQVTDPERILYPLRRAGKRGEGKWERVTWDEVLDDIGGRIRKALVEGRQKEVMYHLGRPGHELIYLQRVFHAWGIDGHNSHTNVCSASARAGYAFWHGLDRPSPDHSKARFILLLSAHLEAGHYFNPHAQRIIDGKMAGAKICVVDTRLSNTASMADYWLSPWPGSEAAMLLAIVHCMLRDGTWDREFVRRWVNWEEYLRRERALHPRVAQRGRRQSLRLGSGARAGADRGPRGRGGHPGRHRPQRVEQGGPGPADDAAAGQGVERAPDAARVPARLLRDELPPAAFSQGSPRQARDVLHAGLQPGVDQPGRHVVDRDADRRGQGRAPRLPHPDLERDRVVRGLRAADGPRLRASRPHEPGDPRRALDRLPPAGAASGAGEAGQDLRSHLAGPRGGRARAGVGGGRVLDRAVVAHRSRRLARHPQVLRVALPAGREAPRRGVLPLDLRAQRARAARGGRAREPDPARLHAQVRRVPGPGQRLPHPRDLAHPGGAGGRGRRFRLAPRHEGWRVGRRGGGRGVGGWLSHPLAQARVLLQDPQGLEVARARGADLRAKPRALVRDRPQPRRDDAAAHIQAAHPDPLALRQRHVAQRDIEQEPAVAASGGRGALPGGDRRPLEGRHRDRPLRRSGLGHRVDPSRRAGLLAPPGALAALRADRRRAVVHRAREARPDRARPVAPPPRARGAAVGERRPRLAAGVVGGRGRAPEPHLPGAPGPGERPALLASEGDGEPTGARRPLRRRGGRHQQVLRGLPQVARDDAAGPGAGRTAPAALAAARLQARRLHLPSRRLTSR